MYDQWTEDEVSIDVQIMRREADELPVESPRTVLEIPVPVLMLLR